MTDDLRAYRIKASNPDYHPMETAPETLNIVVRAVSAQDALTIFKTNNPRLEDRIQNIEDITR